ncbi:hypothetical protein [Leptolyngbya sp. KIOST-1]|uniref:hypothetical protein n=1 Tax=Leptolyngbya sp. KIOST-1 TaxID=1229172 RepID=UPI000565ACE9|nr:hypothetical protein [Leptolyngbya sp. KIOST-1]
MLSTLSTGTAFEIAATTGDAGQLGMAAEFDGYLSDRIGGLIHPIGGAALGGFHRTDLFPGMALGGDRQWDSQFPGFTPSPRWWGYLDQGDAISDCIGDRIPQRYLRPQHFVSQH